MRSHRRKLVVWKQSVRPVDRYSALRVTRIARPGLFRWLAWTVRARWRPIFLVAGALLIVTWMVLPSTMAFVPGMLVLGLSAPDARSDTGLFTLPTAMVRAWSRESKAKYL
jgi:hypothetical protein